jgi:hypothetical protein
VSRSSIVRAAVRNAIDAEAADGAYSISQFSPQQSHLPSDKLEAIKEPKVYVVGFGGDETSITRGRAFEIEQPVQVILKQLIDATDLAAVDALDSLLDELKDTCRAVAGSGSNYRFTHLRNEAMKDPSGLPLNFVLLRQADVYEGAFLAVFKFVQN